MDAGVTDGGVRGERRFMTVLDDGREMSIGGDDGDCTAANFGDDAAEVPSEERRLLFEGATIVVRGMVIEMTCGLCWCVGRWKRQGFLGLAGYRGCQLPTWGLLG